MFFIVMYILLVCFIASWINLWEFLPYGWIFVILPIVLNFAVFYKLFSSGDTESEGCLFSQNEIPASFLEQHTQCVKFFKDCQMSTIQRNLDLLKVMTDDERSKVEEQKDFCVECFFNRYDIKPMQYGARLMKMPRVNITFNSAEIIDIAFFLWIPCVH